MGAPAAALPDTGVPNCSMLVTASVTVVNLVRFGLLTSSQAD